ncbi:putative winged helix-turn-helix domain-containing protein [Pseudomonas phage MR4]|uniref:Putative winged helix-turn-helix domain-containing protein n=1 Tax=Pseudomonas phage MR4 TaxID=2711171 RepID=A0A6M3TCK9_9CAUD|nr:putative winged helix-turn-helix domain-containing protein [Pseudomonas phage MR4]
MTDEIWKDIEGYEGRYMVSNYGRIKNCNRNKLLAVRLDKYGYLVVNLYIGTNGKTYKVHRLVATSFIPNPDKLPHVNHKDKNRANPAVDNLEWVTPQQNVEYSKALTFSFVSPDGSYCSVFNLNKFCRDKSLDLSAMHKVHSGLASHHKGWRKYVPVNV